MGRAPALPGHSRADAVSLDAHAGLAHTRDRFALPADTIYLNGNSLGPTTRTVAQRLNQVVTSQWGQGLIGSWNSADWINLPQRVGDRIAPFIGAAAGDVHVGDSTSVSLFKTMAAAARLRPDRRVIVLESSTFPTDGYIAHGLADLMGLTVRWCDAADPAAAIDDDVALLSLTHVDFRTGAMFDMAQISALAHQHGALAQWDLCHSVGAVPIDLTGAEADFAVGCTYKYLNGGPGAPAFTWVAPRWQDALDQPITGWMGHRSPFAMDLDYSPAAGMAKMASGTPPVLALSCLDAALDAFEGVSMRTIRAVSLSLTSYFMDLVADLPEITVATPAAHRRRGSQVSLRHRGAYGLVQALIARGVIGDFRDPDIARFGLAPLYVRHVDVYDAVAALAQVIERQEYADSAYSQRATVT